MRNHIGLCSLNLEMRTFNGLIFPEAKNQLQNPAALYNLLSQNWNKNDGGTLLLPECLTAEPPHNLRCSRGTFWLLCSTYLPTTPIINISENMDVCVCVRKKIIMVYYGSIVVDTYTLWPEWTWVAADSRPRNSNCTYYIERQRSSEEEEEKDCQCVYLRTCALAAWRLRFPHASKHLKLQNFRPL